MRNITWTVILAVVIGGGFFLAGKYVESRDSTPVTISVSGEGKVSAAPDIAQLTFGVQTGRKATAAEAMALLKEDMDNIMEAVKKAGIEEKDIATEQFYLNPEYDWDEGRQIPRGFQAQETLRVKVRDLDKVSAVLGAATAAGANQAGNVSYTIDDPEVLRAEAREEAIAQAKEKALALAKDLGMRLGKIKGFNEGGGVIPPMPYARAAMETAAEDSAAGMAVPLPAGEQDVTAYVTLTYELK
jgi:hypothetical protein